MLLVKRFTKAGKITIHKFLPKEINLNYKDDIKEGRHYNSPKETFLSNLSLCIFMSSSISISCESLKGSRPFNMANSIIPLKKI